MKHIMVLEYIQNTEKFSDNVLKKWVTMQNNIIYRSSYGWSYYRSMDQITIYAKSFPQ